MKRMPRVITRAVGLAFAIALTVSCEDDPPAENDEDTSPLPSLPPMPPLPAEAFRVEWSAPAAPKVMKAGARTDVAVTIKNLSNVTWPDAKTSGTAAGAVRLGYRWLVASSRAVVSEAPLRTELEAPLQPGRATTLSVLVAAPPTPGDYLLQFILVQELVARFEDQGASPLLVPVRVR